MFLKIRPQGQDAESDEERTLDPVALHERLNQGNAEKQKKNRNVCKRRFRHRCDRYLDHGSNSSYSPLARIPFRDRLAVGRLVLAQVTEVRILVPEPHKNSF